MRHGKGIPVLRGACALLRREEGGGGGGLSWTLHSVFKPVLFSLPFPCSQIVCAKLGFTFFWGAIGAWNPVSNKPVLK